MGNLPKSSCMDFKQKQNISKDNFRNQMAYQMCHLTVICIMALQCFASETREQNSVAAHWMKRQKDSKWVRKLLSQVSLASITTVSCNFFLITFALLSLFLAFFRRPYVFTWYPTAAIPLFLTFDFSSGVANRVGIVLTNANAF
jgi:hypothetical protein